jgi:hypothetical protein
MSLLSRFVRDEAGATAIEYGLIAAGISVVIIGLVYGIGEDRLPECVGQSEVVQRHLRYCREAPAIAGAFLFSMAQPEIHRCRDLRMY